VKGSDLRSKRGFVCSQPLNKKLIEASCAKHVFTSLNIKLFKESLSVVSQVTIFG